MKSTAFSPRRFRLAAVVFGCALTLAAPFGRAQDTAMPTSLHVFDVTEGDTPGQLVLGSDGNFYGTTAFGGFGYTTFQSYAGDGTVYRITPAGEYTTLYAFPGGAQGQNPGGRTDDDLYLPGRCVRVRAAGAGRQRQFLRGQGGRQRHGQ